MTIINAGKRLYRLCSLCFCLCFAPQPALCAENVFKTSLSVRGEYNDNIFVSSGKKADFITTVSPEIEFSSRAERMNAGVSGGLDVVEYSRHGTLNDKEWHLKGQAGWKPGSATEIFVNALYKRDFRPDRDIDDTGLGLDTSVREHQSYGFQGTKRLSDHVHSGWSYSYGRDDFDNPEQYNSRNHSASLFFNYSLDEITAVRTKLGYGCYEYTRTTCGSFSLSPFESGSFCLAETNMTQNILLMAGLERQLGDVWHLSVELGPGYLETEAESILRQHLESLFLPPENSITRVIVKSEKWSATGSLNLSFRGERTRGSLEFSGRVDPASGRSGPSQRGTVALKVNRRFTRAFQGSLSATYYINNFDETTASETDPSTQAWHFASRLRYAFTPDVELEAAYSLRLRKQEDSDSRQTQNVLSIRLYYRHPWLD